MFKLNFCMVIFVISMMIIMGTNSQNEEEDSSDNEKAKLKITILYEAICPDSKRFMVMLGHAYEELGQYLDIELVPFGKSTSVFNGAEFRCHHGPLECEGNRKHSCVLQQLPDQKSKVDFAVCQMKNWDPINVDECASSVGLSVSLDIEDCVQSEEGTQLQLEAERVTKKYHPTFVPSIIYNDHFDEVLQDKSIQNFHQTVCNLLLRTNRLQPNECRVRD